MTRCTCNRRCHSAGRASAAGWAEPSARLQAAGALVSVLTESADLRTLARIAGSAPSPSEPRSHIQAGARTGFSLGQLACRRRNNVFSCVLRAAAGRALLRAPAAAADPAGGGGTQPRSNATQLPSLTHAPSRHHAAQAGERGAAAGRHAHPPSALGAAGRGHPRLSGQVRHARLRWRQQLGALPDRQALAWGWVLTLSIVQCRAQHAGGLGGRMSHSGANRRDIAHPLLCTPTAVPACRPAACRQFAQVAGSAWLAPASTPSLVHLVLVLQACGSRTCPPTCWAASLSACLPPPPQRCAGPAVLRTRAPRPELFSCRCTGPA